MTHEPLCPMFEQCDGDLSHEATACGGEKWCQRCDARCQCDLIARVALEERGRIVAGISKWCIDDPVISRADPSDCWDYAEGVRFTRLRIERGDFASEHLPECPKSGCLACYEQGRTDGILLGQEMAHQDSVIMHEGAAERRGYAKGQRDAIAYAVMRIKSLPYSGDSWHAHAERAAIIAAIKLDQP
jgi:hypothetical protein